MEAKAALDLEGLTGEDRLSDIKMEKGKSACVPHLTYGECIPYLSTHELQR